MFRFPIRFGTAAATLIAAPGPVVTPAVAQAPRPMTFLDLQHLNVAAAPALSPDGAWLVYTLSVPSWKDARRSTDVWIVSTARGVGSERQLTFTPTRNETSPQWSRDGRFFVFRSDRDSTPERPGGQLYVMRPDGGEARRITDAAGGVDRFELTRDGRWLVYSAGRPHERQLWVVPAVELPSGPAAAVQVSTHATPIADWQASWDGRRIFFRAPDTVDQDDRRRRELKFTVAVRNQDPPLQHLWLLDLATPVARRLTGGAEYSVSGVTLSRDGRWAAFRGSPNDRYRRTITESGQHDDLYLVEVETSRIERLTSNDEIGESNVTFSPDSRWMAFSAPNDFVYARDPKLYVRRVDEAGGAWRKLGAGFDGPLSIGWWSDDGDRIYFNAGIRVTGQIVAVDVAVDRVTPLTNERAVVSGVREDGARAVLVTHDHSGEPASWSLAPSEEALGDRSRWTRLTNPNPQVAGFALGAAEEITWRSKDGRVVSGVLIKPVGFTSERRYPLVVQIHGGPAGADLLRFNPGYGSQVYAGAGYAVLLPNYRGSANYGERHRMETAGVGKYFERGFDDIMTGVDHLIAAGIAHPDSLGAMGWSAGGHYSNWILTHTDRFKAISSGAGTVNWISMYGQSDVQRNRQWYMGGKLPYDDHEAWWVVSPLRYIRNAKTPTMIHVVDGDPRVPRPQSDELHMALRQLGVPTEYLVYPGDTHGIVEPRNQLAKAMIELAWFERWIRGKPAGMPWKDLLATLEDTASGSRATTSGTP